MNLDSCGGCHSQPAIGGTEPRGQSAGRVREPGRRHGHGAAVPLGERAGARGAIHLESRRHARTAASTRCSRSPAAPGAGGVHAHAAGLRHGARQQQRDLPDSDAGVRRRADRADLRTRRSSRTWRATRRRRARSASAAAPNFAVSRPHHHADRPTTTATTARSRGSAGRRRTSRCCCSPARPTTSRWASPTSCSRPSATRTRRCQFASHAQQHHRHRSDDAGRRDERDREVRVLHALPRAADAVDRHARAARPRSPAARRCSPRSAARSATRRRSRPATRAVAALRNQTVNLFSDLLVHDMGLGTRRRRQPGRGGPARVPHRAAVGTRAADLLPARRPDLGSDGGHSRAPEHRLGGQRGGLRTS